MTLTIADVLTLEVLTDPDTDTWTSILSSSTTIGIRREVLGPGTISVEIRDAELDPIVIDTLHDGRKVRCQALNADTAALEDLFLGSIRRDGVQVAYDLKNPRPNRQTRISLVAYDVTARLARLAQPHTVLELDALPVLLQDFPGLTWNVNGSTTPAVEPAGGRPLTDPDAKVLDQLVAIRTSTQSYIWVAKDGTIYAISDRTADPYGTGTAILDESAYSQLSVSSGSAPAVNVLTVIVIYGSGAAGETSPGPYSSTFGPFRDEDSIAAYGEIPGTIKVAADPGYGAGLNPAVYLDLFAANAAPTVQVSTLTVPIRTAADITADRALIDLMALAEIINTGKGIDGTARVQSIEHTITADPIRGAAWLTVLGFTASDRIAGTSDTTAPTPPGVIVGTSAGAGLTFINTDEATATADDTDTLVRLSYKPSPGSLHVRMDGIDLAPDEWSLDGWDLTVPPSDQVVIRSGNRITTAYVAQSIASSARPFVLPELVDITVVSGAASTIALPAGTQAGDQLVLVHCGWSPGSCSDPRMTAQFYPGQAIDLGFTAYGTEDGSGDPIAVTIGSGVRDITILAAFRAFSTTAPTYVNDSAPAAATGDVPVVSARFAVVAGLLRTGGGTTGAITPDTGYTIDTTQNVDDKVMVILGHWDGTSVPASTPPDTFGFSGSVDGWALAVYPMEG